MKYIKLFLLITLILPMQIFPSGGSVYSRYGLGDYYYSFTARRMAMGDLGIAMSDYSYLNPLNPASWNNLRLTRFETGMLYNGSQISSNTSSLYQAQTIFTGLMVGFPISYANGISFVGGIVPYSNVSYELFEKQSSTIADDYTLTNKGEGGTSKSFLGVSYRLPFGFSAGASFDYYIGKISHTTSVAFSDTSTFTDASFNNEYSYHGIGFTFGLISNNLAPIFGINDLKDLRVAATFSNTVQLSTDSIYSTNTSIGALENSSFSYKTKLPYRIGVGMSLKWTDNYQIILDYLYQPLAHLSANSVKSSYMRDFYKVSAGMEYRNTNFKSQDFWEQVMFRGGLSYEQSQYTFNGYGINQVSVYGGFSMPLGFESTIDFGFQVGKRGTKENNLLNENIYKFSITLSIGEIWFIRQDR